ncbi:aldehyde dehydrogenase family protein, partial [Citrobacter werkmanii]
TGNAVILRGGKETHHTNLAVVEVIQKALENSGLPADAVQAINNPDRELVAQLLKLDRYVDMLIPRGGAGLHKLCREQSTIPVITGGIGVCHTFVDKSVDFNKAINVIINAKVQRPSACNSLETLLVHKEIANEFLPFLSEKMAQQQVTLHASEKALPLLKQGPA